ncbi:MAG TPA: serine/threonine-protein kinase [Ktedonobacterales bacterium]|nr:serine/threonine-protein kinase [Ktedonobacterales bacterium]
MSLLKQRYRLLSQVGQGGFGAVYRAEDTQLGNRLVAVKEMQPHGLRPQELAEATESFRREGLLLAGLTHANLPRIYDYFSEDGRWYLVMEFIQGETLEAALDREPDGRLPLERVLKIGTQLCQVLDYLHTRQPPIIFRDLKPSNVMLTADETLFLVDFGIARLFKPGQTKDTVAFGTLGYAAPEQFGKAQTTPRSDIYGLGALLHQMLTGNDPSDTPFRFVPLNEPDLAEIGSLIARMVQVDEGNRPASMAEVKQQLEALTAGAAVNAWASGQLVVLGQRQVSAPAAPLADLPHPSQHGPGLSPAYARSVLPTYKGHTGRVNAVAWSPDGQRIVSGSADQTAKVWDVASGKTIWTYATRSKWVLTVAWSPDGQRIVVGGASPLSWWHNPVLVLDAQTGRKLLKYRGHFKWVLAAAWSPDGQRVASAGGGMFSRWDDAVYVWDATTGKTVSTYDKHTNKIDAVAWSPDGTKIASASADETVRVWVAASAQPLLTYRGHRWIVRAVAWSPDGTRLASAGDRTVQVWQADNPLVVYNGHVGRVYAVAWSPDGLHIASGSHNGAVHVWDARTGGFLYSYDGHNGPVSAVAWSPDGRWIASAGADATVQVWDGR